MSAGPFRTVEPEREIRFAGEADAAAAVAIWREVSDWLAAIGQPLWSGADFDVASALAAVADGELVLGISDGRPAACMLLSRCDPVFWPEAAADAAVYVHKLAVVRRQAGAGWPLAMLGWAARHAAEIGADAVRLDCAPRASLVRIYRQCGFVPVDPGPVSRGGFSVLRFERNVG